MNSNKLNDALSVLNYLNGIMNDDMFKTEIAAVKKQIPMKIVRKFDLWTECPCCGFEIPPVWDYGSNTYCNRCGQKLDWSEE